MVGLRYSEKEPSCCRFSSTLAVPETPQTKCDADTLPSIGQSVNRKKKTPLAHTLTCLNWGNGRHALAKSAVLRCCGASALILSATIAFPA